MKKITFLIVGFMLLTGTAKAREIINISNMEIRPYYNFDEPVSFIERGVEFFVFSNGDFDFNTRPQDSYGSYFYKAAGKRSTVSANRGPINYGILIEHDGFGRVRRVGNTFINYDFSDRVSRIGTVYIRYNRYALTQVGGLHIIYNRHGEIIDMIGSVKGYRNHGYAYSNYSTANCDYEYNYSNSYGNHSNYSFNNNDYYYYRADGSKAKKEDSKTEEKK